MKCMVDIWINIEGEKDIIDAIVDYELVLLNAMDNSDPDLIHDFIEYMSEGREEVSTISLKRKYTHM